MPQDNGTVQKVNLPCLRACLTESAVEPLHQSPHLLLLLLLLQEAQLYGPPSLVLSYSLSASL